MFKTLHAISRVAFRGLVCGFGYVGIRVCKKIDDAFWGSSIRNGPAAHKYKIFESLCVFRSATSMRPLRGGWGAGAGPALPQEAALNHFAHAADPPHPNSTPEPETTHWELHEAFTKCRRAFASGGLRLQPALAA